MLPDAKWLDALKLPPKATVSVAISSGLLLALDLGGVFDLGALAPIARPVLIIVAVVFGTLSLVAFVEMMATPMLQQQRLSLLALRRSERKREEERTLADKERKILARLDHLSAEEIHYVAECLRKGSPSFYTYVFSPPVSQMQTKMLVWSPGGQHHQDHYPFSFQDFVWRVLLDRKDEFISKDDAHKLAAEEAKRAERRRGY